MSADEQAWDDYGNFVGGLNRAASDIQQIGNKLKELGQMKTEILDDPVRKAELKKIIDQRPDMTMTSITNLIAKLTTLYQYLDSNTYLS